MKKFTIVDIGARGGPRPAWLKIDSEIIGFEPDKVECERLKTAYPAHTFVPLALDAEPRRRKIYITVHDQCSSFYKPIQTLVDRGIANHAIDHESEIDTTSLDRWWLNHAEGRQIDLLKLDTQGSELDILKGAVATLEHVQVVMSEVEFNPFYEGQPLFGDVDRWMRDRGFELLALQDFNFCWHQLYWCDAYWTRTPMSERAREVASLACGLSSNHPFQNGCFSHE
jgi:FkbM family methyltransferase